MNRATITVYVEERPGGNRTDCLRILPLERLILNAYERHLRITGLVYALESERTLPKAER